MMLIIQLFGLPRSIYRSLRIVYNIVYKLHRLLKGIDMIHIALKGGINSANDSLVDKLSFSQKKNHIVLKCYQLDKLQ